MDDLDECAATIEKTQRLAHAWLGDGVYEVGVWHTPPTGNHNYHYLLDVFQHPPKRPVYRVLALFEMEADARNGFQAVVDNLSTGAAVVTPPAAGACIWHLPDEAS